MVPDKLLAFAGPTAEVKHYWGHRSFTPEDYHGYFAESGVGAVVRLNNEVGALSPSPYGTVTSPYGTLTSYQMSLKK